MVEPRLISCQQPYFYRDGNFKVVLRWDKGKNALGNYVEKQLYFVGTNELPNRLIFVTQRTSYSHESESMEGNFHVKY